jgi:protein arginine kinase
VIQTEARARHTLMRDAGPSTENLIWRAYGLLRYARLLSYKDLMELLSGVRLGVSLKLLPGPPVYTLNRMMIFSQAAHLDQAAGRELSKPERQAHRAGYVRRVLSHENEPPTSGPGG